MYPSPRILPTGLSANRVDFGFCLSHKFSNITPPPQNGDGALHVLTGPMGIEVGVMVRVVPVRTAWVETENDIVSDGWCS